jgi:hypothetical protein
MEYNRVKKIDMVNMDEKTIQAIKTVLAKGERVELIPVKNGVKVIRVRREELTNGTRTIG